MSPTAPAVDGRRTHASRVRVGRPPDCHFLRLAVAASGTRVAALGARAVLAELSRTTQAVLHGVIALWALTMWATDPASTAATVATASSATAVVAGGLCAAVHDAWSVESYPHQSAAVAPSPDHASAAAKQHIVGGCVVHNLLYYHVAAGVCEC